MRTHRWLTGPLALALGLLPAVVSAQSADGLALIEAVAARYRASPALCADFVRELVVPLLGERHTGRGRLCQRQPDLFMMRFSDPDGDRIIIDGQHVWVYTPSTDPGTVTQFPLGSAPGAFDFHREFLENPGGRYEVRLDGEETLEGATMRRVVLVPRQREGYREAVLWIDARQNLVRQVQIREENGSVQTISLSHIDLNASPGTEAFRFTQPPGTRIFRP
jgi:outer membrane lipoprotein-sorting protein